MATDRDEKVDAWMPLFVCEFLAATAGLTAEQGWAYTCLLCHLWIEHGYVVNDPRVLAQLARVDRPSWPAVWSGLAKFFDVQNGRVSQGRLLHEREKALKLRKARSDGGKAGATKRWQDDGAAQDGSAMPEPLAKSWPLPSPSPSPSPSPGPIPKPDPEGSASRPLALVIASPSPSARDASKAPSKAPSKACPLITASTSSGTSLGTSLRDRALGAFTAAWERRYGAKYSPTPADISQLGRLLTTLPRERIAALPACFTRYLADESPWVAQEKRHSLSWFLKDDGANKYAVEAKVMSSKEARGKTAAAQWLGGRNDAEKH